MNPVKFSAVAAAAILALTAAAIITTGCSGSMAAPLTVQAATAPYSTASLNGAYAINLITATTNYGYTQSTALGTVSFDGSGNILPGASVTLNFAGAANACTASPAGTYIITGTGSGSASIKLSPSGVNPCQQVTTIGFSVQVAQSGAVALLQESDNQGFAIGTAAKM